MLISELAERAEIKYTTALVVALGCKKLKTSLAIFHRCQSQPVELKSLGTGFPGLPYPCPCCGELVIDGNDLQYDTKIE